jgi:hypothetical protein
VMIDQQKRVAMRQDPLDRGVVERECQVHGRPDYSPRPELRTLSSFPFVIQRD